MHLASKEYAQRGLKAFRETNDLHEALQFFEEPGNE